MSFASPMEEVAETVPPAVAKFSILQQDVDLDLDFAERCIRGTTRILVQPLDAELHEVSFACRQTTIKRIKVDKFAVQNYEYKDPYDTMKIRDEYTVHQHHWIGETVTEGFTHKVEADLKIPLPPKLKLLASDKIMLRTSSMSFAAAAENNASAPADDPSSKYRPFTVEIDYELRQLRDGLHWVGLDEDDHRFPHVYTYSNSLAHTLANYVFPCMDQADKKIPWKLSITCPRTLGDLYEPSSLRAIESNTNGSLTNGVNGFRTNDAQDGRKNQSPFTAAEKALEMQVVCSGYMEDSDAPTDNNDRRRKWIFNCATPVLPRHVGFAIGPFEEVDLSQYRESEQDDKMGMSAVKVHGFCLPGRSNELRNTCMPLASALDKLSTAFVFYPFESEQSSYKVAFVDDLTMNVVDTATLSICSSRLLVAENILDPLYESTRELVHAVASQWIGVKITPQAQDDIWLIVGGSYFMADWFMMTLWGRNEHRFRLKMAADKVHELDVTRPALIYLGAAVEVDPDEYEFLKLKAPLVLSILHHRILKANGRIGVNRALSRVLFDDQNGKLEDSVIDTSQFQRACEKVSHGRLDAFFNQWIYGRGCPTFRITQRFNKKKLVVEMLIVQVQAEEQIAGCTTSGSFMREAKESVEDVDKGVVPLLFTGPMTMRIHEADGTPYEHIVDIKELTTKVEIPYNTKYKRLKRSRRARERAVANAGNDAAADAPDDALLYCLGDVLQTEEEMREWDLADWSKEDDDRMNNEHFEWIRLDKDFEWIAKISFNQPHYMFVSQLQQDNDVVAQTESLQYLMAQQPFKLVSTILVRTLMDTRYFYGLRIIAAHALAKCAVPELDWVGFKHLQKAFQTFYCFENSNMTRSNDFSDLRVYKIQCAIPAAIAKIRDSNGCAPERVKQFFLDTLKFNDNSNNEYSDSFYIATLMAGLAKSIAATGFQSAASRLSDEELMNLNEDEQQRIMAEEEEMSKTRLADAEYQSAALEEIQRFRRIDEWIPSFENQYTITALEGVKNLMTRNLVPTRLKDFLFYTRPQNSAPVRLRAFDCLIDLGAFEEPTVMSYFMVSFFEDSSPYFRGKLWKVIGRAFAEIALKETDVKVVQPDGMDGLVLESTEKVARERQNAMVRSQALQTIDGLIDVLKDRVGGIQEVKDVLLEALKSPKLGIEHFLDLLSVCKILYEEKRELKLKLRLPNYWRVTHTGNGQVTFKSTNRYRSKPYTKLEDRWKRPVSAPAPAAPPTPITTAAKPPMIVLKRSFTASEGDAASEQKRPRLSTEANSGPTIKLSTKSPDTHPSAPAAQSTVPAPPLVPAALPAEPRKIITLSLKQNQNKPAAPSPSPVAKPPSSILKLKPSLTPSQASPTPPASSTLSNTKPRSKVVTFSLPSSKLSKFPSGIHNLTSQTLAPSTGPAPSTLPNSSRGSSPSTLSVASDASDASSADIPLASTAASRSAAAFSNPTSTQAPQISTSASSSTSAAAASTATTSMKPPPLTIPPPPTAAELSGASSMGPKSASAQTPVQTPGGSGFKLKLTFGKKT